MLDMMSVSNFQYDLCHIYLSSIICCLMLIHEFSVQKIIHFRNSAVAEVAEM